MLPTDSDFTRRYFGDPCPPDRNFEWMLLNIQRRMAWFLIMIAGFANLPIVVILLAADVCYWCTKRLNGIDVIKRLVSNIAAAGLVVVLCWNGMVLFSALGCLHSTTAAIVIGSIGTVVVNAAGWWLCKKFVTWSWNLCERLIRRKCTPAIQRNSFEAV
jgi:hypothetical protein